MGQKLFRDSVYDYITIDKKKHPWLLDLINTPEVQRLRFISQLGLSQFTYPGSNHSRFSHSLGVLNLMTECVNHLKQEYPERFKRLDEEALLAVSLLHDIGHSPLSHATEKFFGDHEERAVRIILNKESQVYKVLHKRSPTLPSKVAGLILDKPLKGAKSPELWQKSLISSQLDMDRLDYLRRDSLCSGAEYGNFDCFRIIHTMELREKSIGNKKDVWIVWPEKSKYAIEEYIFSRFYMYQSVYFHHSTRQFECLLRSVLKRAADICTSRSTIRRTLIRPLEKYFLSRRKDSLQFFQGLTDNALLAQIFIWQDARDKILRDLARRLIERKGIGWYEIQEEVPFDELHTKVQKVEEYLSKERLDPAYYLLPDTTTPKVYAPYKPASETDDQSSVNSIILYNSSWKPAEFCEISDVPGLDRIRVVTKPSLVNRYYFPREHGNKIKKLLS